MILFYYKNQKQKDNIVQIKFPVENIQYIVNKFQKY